MAADIITILQARGSLRLNKTWQQDGSIKGYDEPKFFKIKQIKLSGMAGLSKLLHKLADDPHSCVIRGTFVGTETAAQRGFPDNDGHYVRQLQLFDDTPHHWVCFDIDHYDPPGDVLADPAAAIDRFVLDRLPPEFTGKSYHWQLSNSFGHPSKGNELRAHLWFWLAKPVDSATLATWAKGAGAFPGEYDRPPVDLALFRVVQVHYTANPSMAKGVAAPVLVRQGYFEGWDGDEVELDIEALAGEVRRLGSDTAGHALERIDPTLKPGIIGHFCRLYPPARLIDEHEDGGGFLNEVFERETDQTSRRLNFLGEGSGGTPGGAFITDDDNYIGNSHNSDPFGGRIANSWDLVRQYRFGHLDAGLTEVERLVKGIEGLPSQQAMYTWAKELPEIQDALDGRDPGESAAAAEQAREVTEAFKQRMADATDEGELREVAVSIKLDWQLDRINRAVLADVFKNRFQELTGHTLGIELARQELAPMRRRGSDTGDQPEWVREWVYVTTGDFFLNLKTKEQLTLRSFNTKFAAVVRQTEGEGHAPPAEYAAELYHMPIYNRALYAPAKPPIFKLYGLDAVNTYRPESVPAGKPPENAAERALVAAIDRHLSLFIPDDEYRDAFKQWMAFVVRNPGVRVRWSPLLKGVEGDGKTLLSRLMAVSMGWENIKVVSGNTLMNSPFTGFLGSSALLVVEEIRVNGANRYQIWDKLKPVITNDEIEVHKKGMDPVTVDNCTVTIMFTNHDDALPLDDHDRRVMVLFSPFDSYDELEEAIQAMHGVSIARHWDELVAILNDRPDLARGWFDAVDISKFAPNGRAPHTIFKDSLVEINRNEEEDLARDVIAAGAVGVSKAVISSKFLTRAMAARDPDLTIRTKTVNKLLSQLGYVPLATPGHQVKWQDTTCRVWVKKGKADMSTDDVRAELDKTLSTDFRNNMEF